MAAAIEGMSGELDIFEKPVIQTGIVGGNWYQFKPITPVADGNQITFSVSGQGDQYVDLARTLLNLKIQILKADGTVFPATDNVGPVNNIFDTVFSNVQVDFNQKRVSDSRNLYHYRAYLEDLFNFNETAKGTHMSASLWYQDLPGEFDSAANPSFIKRRNMCAGGKVLDLAGQLHCDLFNTSKFLLNDVDIRITLTKNNVGVCLLGEANTQAKIKILDATLWMRKARINPSILLAHAKSLNHHTAKYPYKRVEMHHHTIPQGTQQQTIENLFLGRIPSRLMVGFVEHAAFSGAMNKNPFNFQNFGLNHLAIFKCGEQVSSRPYNPVFGQNNPSYVIPYIMSFFGTGNHLADDGYCVNLEGWQHGYCIYPFDLTHDLSAHEQHWCIQEQGNLRMEVGFDNALTAAVTVIIYAEFREVMEIDKNRECSMEYTK